MLNIYTAWIGIFLGCIAGAIPGMFFHHEEWLGGYASWPRRMIRLGHISFFGIAFINLSFGLTVRVLQIETGTMLPSWLFVVGAIMMPTVCYLSAAKPPFRQLFFIPAGSVSVGVALFLWRLLAS